MRNRNIFGIVSAACVLAFSGTALAQMHWEEEESSSVTDSPSGVGTSGLVQRAGDEIIGSVLAPQVKPVAMTKGEAPVFDSVGSLFRYEHRKFDNSNVYYDRYGLTLHGTWNAAADLPVDIAIPIDRYEFNNENLFFGGTADMFDNTTVGIVITPRYYLLYQAESGLDLAIGVNTFYYHSFVDAGPMDDRDVIGGGPLVSVRKDFEKFSLSGGVMMQRGWNMNGDREITGHRYVDSYRAAVNVGVPIGENLAINGVLTYTYVDDLPSMFEDSYMSAGIGATWIINGNWALDGAIMTDIDNSDSNNILAMIGMVWTY